MPLDVVCTECGFKTRVLLIDSYRIYHCPQCGGNYKPDDTPFNKLHPETKLITRRKAKG